MSPQFSARKKDIRHFLCRKILSTFFRAEQIYFLPHLCPGQGGTDLFSAENMVRSGYELRKKKLLFIALGNKELRNYELAMGLIIGDGVRVTLSRTPTCKKYETISCVTTSATSIY